MDLSTFDINGFQYTITDYQNVVSSNHYSDKGSGFGFLSITLNRKYGINYNDIGYGYKIRLTKGLKKILFNGWITEISEGLDDTIELACVGSNTLLSFDITNFVLADNRVNRWTTACTSRGSYRPDKFDHSLNWTEIINEGTPSEEEVSYDGIEIKPRRGIDYNEDDYYYIRYRFEFGETATRLQFTYKLSLLNNWPGKIMVLDADENILWQSDVSGNGTQDLDLTTYTNGNFVEFRFEVTTSGLNTAEEDTIYFRAWDLLVSSTNATMDAAVVVKKCAEYMATNFGFSTDYSLINTIGYEIPQAAFDADESLDKICNDACIYGDSDANPLAWGTAFDDQNRMFLEVQDLSTVGYILTIPESFTITGDLSESYQKVYGKYVDTTGRTQRTSVLSATDEIEGLGGLYRKTVIDLDKEIESSQMLAALNLALNENKQPKVSTSFSIANYVESPQGALIPIDEIVSGRLVQVPSLQTVETGILDDKRKGFHTFMLTKVEIDHISKTATLTPAGDVSNFENYMALLKRLAK